MQIDHDPRLFWTIFSAVLCAGMLLIALVWAGVNISRREEAKESFSLYLGVVLLVFAFAGVSFYISMGGQ